MKLKKIVSLALAGVLAVSMLAGCKDNSSSSSSSESTETVVGYSSKVQGNLSNTATEKVALSDSAELNDALKAAMEYATNGSIAGWYDGRAFVVTRNVNSSNGAAAAELIRAADDLISTMDAENNTVNGVWTALNNLNPTPINYNEKDLNAALLFVVDGGKGVNAVMDEVADLLNDGIESLNKHYEQGNIRADYDYTGSVSAYTKTLTGDHDKSLTFIAVNIAREIV